MSLTTGQSLSFYEILGPIGAGAMGEVYRARDTRLEREVAIKVLPEHFVEDDERLRRFEREAKSLAALNHPNVAQIFGVDQVEDTCFLVLELVPGQTLEERIARGPLPLGEALEVCCQIADGLEAAHAAGVIHRDLKPANVRITPSGDAKVLDFGLAKAARGDAGDASTTDSVLSTEAGRLLGTPTYMAPEQARGRPIDRRVDVWALACVLYECLTAERAFAGETLSDVLASVLQDEPDWTRLPASTPDHVRAVLERSLRKDPRQRLRDVGDVRMLLASPIGSSERASLEAKRGVGRVVAWIAAGVALAGLGFAVGGGASRGASGEAPRAIVASIHVPETCRVRSDSAPVVALSPDGRTLVWVGGAKGELFVRTLDSFDIRVLPATETAVGPFFSPDSQRIGFWKAGELMSIAVAGGAPATIADVPGRPNHYRGASWGDDGVIVFAPTIASGLYRVAASGGPVEELTTLEPASNVRTHRYPEVLPGARVVLYTRDDKRTPDFHDDASIVARSLVTGEERVVVEGAGQARYAAGHLVFVRGAALHAVAFDPETLEVRGAPREIVAGVECQTSSGIAFFDLARDGTLVYQPGLDRAQTNRIAWRAPGVAPDVFDLAPGSYENPRLSPDGRYVSYTTSGADLGELWVYSLDRKAARLLLRQPDIITPVWSRDSSKLYFGAGLALDPALHEIDVVGAGTPRLVREFEGDCFTMPMGVTPDGKTILVVVDDKRGGADVFGVDAGSGEMHDVLTTAHAETEPALDPSGKWLAFTHRRDGDLNVYLTTLAPGGPLVQVSHLPGRGPSWSPDGSAIYFLRQGTRELWEVGVELEGEPAAEVPRPLLDDFYWDDTKPGNYDVAPDGRVLTLIDSGGSELGRELRIQSTWLDGELGGPRQPRTSSP